MNSDISLMIELQHHWDSVMKHEAEKSRAEKSINTWETHLKNDRSLVEKKEKIFSAIQKQLKEREGALADIESRLKKAEQRKDLLKSGREVEAHENEIIRLENEKEKIELVVLDLMEQSETSGTELEALNRKLEETVKQTGTDVAALKKKIDIIDNEISDIKNKFDLLSGSLSPQIRSRFLKIIHSKDGVAIAKLNGEICSHCNFQVPSSLATAVSKNQSAEICTNCGRFIYY